MLFFYPRKWFRLIKTALKNLILYYLLPDKVYLKCKYKKVFKKKLNLKNPLTFSEKTQWLKLYDRNPIYQKMIDKYEAKKFVASIIGDQYIIPTLGIWSRFEDIDFNKLPEKFVLKCTHDAASTIVCHDKSKLNLQDVKLKIIKALKQDYYRFSNKQWAYKGIKPRIIAEKFLTDSSDVKVGLIDYKLFCFNGSVHCVMLVKGREVGEIEYHFFDKNWELLRYLTYDFPGINERSDFIFQKPRKLDEMFLIAEKLSQNIPFVRVDLYLTDELIYFGELTFYHYGGMDTYILPDVDLLLGNMIELKK